MKSLFSFVLTLAIALTLAACGRGSDGGNTSTAGDYVEETEDTDVTTAGDYAEDAAIAEGPQTYYCEEGTAFTVTFDNEAEPQTASIEMAGETTVLESVVSASGARYSNGDMVAWFEGATEASFAASGGDEAEMIVCARH